MFYWRYCVLHSLLVNIIEKLIPTCVVVTKMVRPRNKRASCIDQEAVKGRPTLWEGTTSEFSKANDDQWHKPIGIENESFKAPFSTNQHGILLRSNTQKSRCVGITKEGSRNWLISSSQDSNSTKNSTEALEINIGRVFKELRSLKNKSAKANLCVTK